MCLAVPGKIIELSEDNGILRTGIISFGGIVKEASLAFLPEAKVGDYVIVHAGVALNTVDEEEAAKILETLEEIGELER